MPRSEHAPTDRFAFSRRKFLQGITGVGVELILPKHSESQVINEIRLFENTIRDREVTYAEAEAYAPLISKLYTDFILPDKTVETFIDQTYIIPSFADRIADPKKSTEFLSQYFSPELVLATLSSPDQLGLTFSTGNMYVFLQKTNTLNGERMQDATSAHTEFQSMDAITACAPSTPITRLRQTLLHEHAHSDLNVDDLKAKTRGFRIVNDDGRIVEYFEEFFADFTAASISNYYDLPFNTGYGFEPSDFANFRKVMQQSGITLQELANLHRNSNLFSFINEISNGIELEKSTPEFQEAVAQISEALFRKSDHQPDWDDVSDYFPHIDTEEYQYNPPVLFYPSDTRPLQGCTVNE